jgi:magnesium chelatase subunit I
MRFVPPAFMREVVAELTQQARRSADISQRSGVSVRVTICNWENLLSAALKRAIRLREREAAPRLSDLGAIVASTAGKIELESLGEASEEKVVGKLVQRAVLSVFNRTFGSGPGELDAVVAAFQAGLTVDVGEDIPSRDYVRQVDRTPALRAAVGRLGVTAPAAVASALEFVLEGLHLGRKLNKDTRAREARYRD